MTVITEAAALRDLAGKVICEPFASDLPRIEALRAAMERQAHRYRTLRDVAAPHVKEPLRRWFSERYSWTVVMFAREINACDSIIGKQYFFNYYTPLVGHKELFTATVTEGEPECRDDADPATRRHARLLELTTLKQRSIPSDGGCSGQSLR